MCRIAFCVCLGIGILTCSHVAAAATTDVVLYASDAVNLHGNWSRASDASEIGRASCRERVCVPV